jgi:hypothetical protein
METSSYEELKRAIERRSNRLKNPPRKNQTNKAQTEQELIGLRKDREKLVKEEVLDYLINEGFADTEANAEAIMLNMSEEWLNDIIEGFVPLSKEKEARVTGALKKNMDTRTKDNMSVRKDTASLKKVPRPLRKYTRRNKRLLTQLDKYRYNPKGLNKNNLLQNAKDSLTHTHAHRAAENIYKQNQIKRKIDDLKNDNKKS